MSVLYGLYDSSGESHLSVEVSALYNSTFRSAWGLAVCWVILSCATGHGGLCLVHFTLILMTPDICG